jgi:hypothetical protein
LEISYFNYLLPKKPKYYGIHQSLFVIGAKKFTNLNANNSSSCISKQNNINNMEVSPSMIELAHSLVTPIAL